MIIKLVEKRLVPVDRKAEVVAICKTLLDMAERGEVDTLLFICADSESMWRFDYAGKAFTTELLGRIDIAKAEIISKYLASEC
jgi:hypothetical protein